VSLLTSTRVGDTLKCVSQFLLRPHASLPVYSVYRTTLQQIHFDFSLKFLDSSFPKLSPPFQASFLDEVFSPAPTNDSFPLPYLRFHSVFSDHFFFVSQFLFSFSLFTHCTVVPKLFLATRYVDSFLSLYFFFFFSMESPISFLSDLVFPPPQTPPAEVPG